MVRRRLRDARSSVDRNRRACLAMVKVAQRRAGARRASDNADLAQPRLTKVLQLRCTNRAAPPTMRRRCAEPFMLLHLRCLGSSHLEQIGQVVQIGLVAHFAKLSRHRACVVCDFCPALHDNPSRHYGTADDGERRPSDVCEPAHRPSGFFRCGSVRPADAFTANACPSGGERGRIAAVECRLAAGRAERRTLRSRVCSGNRRLRQALLASRRRRSASRRRMPPRSCREIALRRAKSSGLVSAARRQGVNKARKIRHLARGRWLRAGSLPCLVGHDPLSR